MIIIYIETFLPMGWRTFIWWKNLPKDYTILVWIAGCWNSSLMSPNLKNNCWLSSIFGAQFGGKDCGLCPYKPWSQQAGGWIHFWVKRLRTLNSYQIFKIKNRKLKTYSGWCPFKGLSNGTTKKRKLKLKNQIPIAVDDLFKACTMISLSCIFIMAG